MSTFNGIIQRGTMLLKTVLFTAVVAVARAGVVSQYATSPYAYAQSAPLAYTQQAPLAYAAHGPALVSHSAPLAYAAHSPALVSHSAPLAYASHGPTVVSHGHPLSYAQPTVYSQGPAVVSHAAPVAYAHAPIAKAVLPTAVDTDYDPNPSYSYAYDVQDALTGDSKNQQESRQGDVVQGSYSLTEPDGTRRTVEYTADPQNGFNAVVHREPAVQKAVVAKVAAPVAYASHAPAVYAQSPYAYASHAPTVISHSSPAYAYHH